MQSVRGGLPGAELHYDATGAERLSRYELEGLRCGKGEAGAALGTLPHGHLGSYTQVTSFENSVRRQVASGFKCHLRVDRNAELSDQAENGASAFISHRTDLGYVLTRQVLESNSQIDNGLDLIEGRPSNIEMLPKLLRTASARTLSDVQDDTRSGASPLIGETTSLGRRQTVDYRFGKKHECTRVLPCLQVLEMAHDERCEGRSLPRHHS